MRTRLGDLVPADVRHFVAGLGRLEAFDLTGDHAQAGRAAVFFRMLEHDLGAQADAEKRCAPRDHRAQTVGQAERAQGLHGGPGRADAGKHHPFGGQNAGRVRCDLRRYA